jgi:hypothetical protein
MRTTPPLLPLALLATLLPACSSSSSYKSAPASYYAPAADTSALHAPSAPSGGAYASDDAGIALASEEAAPSPLGVLDGLAELAGDLMQPEGAPVVARRETEPAPPPAEAPPLPKTAEAPAPPERAARLMVYTASFQVLVPAAEPAVDALLARVQALGGHLADRTDNRITVRVPAARFHALVDDVTGLGVVTARQMKAEDVTDRYTDLALRIENAERSRQRLLQLIEEADETKDLLEIEAQLRRLTEEIERMKGQLRLLKDHIALSTLTVDLRENAPAPRPVHYRQYSRFEWINRVGVENVLQNH